MRAAIPDPGALLAWKSADRATLTATAAHDAKAKAPAIQAIIRAWIEHL